MNRTIATLLVMLLGACAPDPRRAEHDVRARVERTMGAFAAMDMEGFKAGLAEDVTAFEMDLDGRPVRLGSRDDVLRFAGETFAQLKKMGAKVTLDIHSTHCRVNSTMADCIVEFDFKASMADGSTMSQPTRNTIVLRKGDDGWTWTHWHSSLAAPSAPSSAP